MFFFDLPSAVPDIDRMMDSYGTDLLRLCYLYLKDYQLAEDAVQETFLRVYTKYSTFRAQSSEKTWITRIAMNICRDMMRRPSYREPPGDFSDYMLQDSSADPEQTTMDTESNIALLDALTALPEIYRKTLLLYYYSGFKTWEIARILHTAKSTVNVRLKRGREMLRSALDDDEV